MKPETRAACEAAMYAIARANALIDEEAKAAIALDSPPDLVRYYADLREQGEGLRASVAPFAALEKDLSYQYIPLAFDAAGIQNIKLPGYGLVALNRRWSCSMLSKARGFEYLRRNGQAGMIIETVPAPTLGAWAREETEERGVEPPDDIFKTSIARYVSLTGEKKPSPQDGGK